MGLKEIRSLGILCACAFAITSIVGAFRNDGYLLYILVQRSEAPIHSFVQTQDWLGGYEDPQFDKHFAGSNKDLFKTLRGLPVKPRRRSGYVYAITTPYKPGFIKIGWAKSSAEKRVKEFDKYYPEAALLFCKDFEYPE